MPRQRDLSTKHLAVSLWPDDYFIRRVRNLEPDAACEVGVDGLGEIQGGKLDLSVPDSMGGVAALVVQNSLRDGVVRNLFAVAVAEDENRRLSLSDWPKAP